jgi:hypothetical protein
MDVACLYIGYLKGGKRQKGRKEKRERLRVRKKERESQEIEGNSS